MARLPCCTNSLVVTALIAALGGGVACTAGDVSQEDGNGDGDGVDAPGDGDDDITPPDLDIDPDMPTAPGCGNSELADHEACDDGNSVSNDGCVSDCTLIEQGYECFAPGEPCVRTELCGDSIVSGIETCDDGNTDANDGCSAACFVEKDFVCPAPGEPCESTVVCGDGRVAGSETCDDGDTGSGDGCADLCQLEPGWNCSSSGFACVSACGDGLIVGAETCDDGNTTPEDGCGDACQAEPGYACPEGEDCYLTVCGDGVQEGDEPCDDGNNGDMGDGCSPGCRLEPECSGGECRSRCGDGLILAGDDETCDDGNTVSGDGCSAECQIEHGFTCTVVSDTDEGQLSLPIVLRDFLDQGSPQTLTDDRVFSNHTDFGGPDVVELKNMVEMELAPVGDLLNAPYKPVYNALVAAAQPGLVESRESFNQWYADTPGINLTFVDTLTLTAGAEAGTFEFEDPTFFPLDGRGFSDPTLAQDGVSTEYLAGLCDNAEETHGFLFTSEVRYWFEYHGGEKLVFRGDDDVWVFIKNRLVVDLGGVHGALGGDVCGNSFHPDYPAECAGLSAATVDRNGDLLNLVEGQVYEIAVFQAERRACQSSYRLTLSGFSRTRTECESTCGDGELAGDERCDDGENNGAGYGFCGADCQPGPRCGDAVVNGEETCDNGTNSDGYQLSTESCGADCSPPAFCGDGIIDAAYGEQCDAGGESSAGGYNGCTDECELGPHCGDGTLTEPEEQCDDGNRINNDGCNVNCRTERVVVR